MNKRTRYSPEVKERAVRMVFEHTDEQASQWATICSIAEKIGCSPETLRKWTQQAERNRGLRPGLTSDEKARLKELERENRELRRANEILRKASAYFTSTFKIIHVIEFYLSIDGLSCRLSLTQTPSQLESMVQEAKLLRKIIEGESNACKL